MRVLLADSGRNFYVKDVSKDYHCQFGYIKKEQLKKTSGFVTTNTGKELAIFPSSYIDRYKRMKRSAQTIPLKEIGMVIAETGIDKNSVVVDAGAGSGAMSIFLAHLVKKVHSFDIRDDHMETVKYNIKDLGIKNIVLKKQNIYEKIPVKNTDLVMLDVPEPWLALDNAVQALKHGGFVIAYSPTIPQIMDFSNAVRKNKDVFFLKAVEIIKRDWEADERKVRPKSSTMHSGFLVFARRR